MWLGEVALAVEGTKGEAGWGSVTKKVRACCSVLPFAVSSFGGPFSLINLCNEGQA